MFTERSRRGPHPTFIRMSKTFLTSYEGMELPASAQDGPSCEREIVEPKFGGRWDEALELERRAFRIRNGLPPGEQLSIIQNLRLSFYLKSDVHHFTLCCVVSTFENVKGQASCQSSGNKWQGETRCCQTSTIPAAG